MLSDTSMSQEQSRFFDDPTSSVKKDQDPIQHQDLPSSASRTPSSPTPQISPADEEVPLPSNSLFVLEDNQSDDDDGFTLFESQIQAIVPNICPAIVSKLYSKYRVDENPILAAVNEYYDGQNTVVERPEPVPLRSSSTTLTQFSQLASSSPSQLNPTKNRTNTMIRRRTSSQVSDTSSPRKRVQASLPQKQLPPQVSWRRFIGSLQVVAWATRPTLKTIPYGTRLTAVKNAQGSQAPRRGRRGVTSSVSSFIKLVQDYDDPANSKEIGRVPEEFASFLFPLLDQEICDFDFTVVFCDGRLSTGDSFIVQLDCYLTNKIFEASERNDVSKDELKQMKSSQAFSKQHIETEAEQQERRRQIALLKLFNQLDFKVKSPEEPEEEVEATEEVIDLEDEEEVQNLDSPQNDTHSSQQVDEMNLNQLKEFYKRTQTEKVLAMLPETETKDNFKLDLRSYQKQGLTWMLRSERELENKDEGDLMNPLWKEFKWPKDRSWPVMRDENLRQSYKESYFYGNLYSGEFSLEKPILKSLCRGGILADEMGLGKTVSTLSLIHNAPFDKRYLEEGPQDPEYAYKTTLIIVPTSLLQQWQDEFYKANNDNSSIFVYYGSDAGVNLKDKLCKSDSPLIVFTTYGTIQSEWSRLVSKITLNDGVFSLKFFRVVLDEGHNIRNRMAKTTKACYEIRASRKWLLTGTPIVNRLDDLYSLVKFLQLQPWSNISYWNTFVTQPFEKKRYKQALDVVQAILEPVLLRRTKNMKKDGKPLVELPPKEVNIERIKFSPKEKALYDWFLARAESSVKASIKKGDILKRYTAILVHILRLRQLCCHMDLIHGGNDEMDEDISSKVVTDYDIPNELLSKSQTFSIEQLSESKQVIHDRFEKVDDLECSICTTQPIPFDNLAFTECGHPYCLSCILEHCDYQEMHGNETVCPNCRVKISSAKLLQPKLRSDAVTGNLTSSYQLYRYDNSLRSSKLNALLSHLRVIRDTSPNEKVVVFSQFSSYLDIMERELQLENGLTIFKFDGRMSMEKRSEILREFKKPRLGSVTVLLLSLKAGGVGLNLTEASRAFMCDPWWSPSIEDQAIDRIHRIGQESNVKVTRFIMEGSIEEKMLKIQERKRTIGEAVEAEEEERRKRRVEEIQMLFEST